MRKPKPVTAPGPVQVQVTLCEDAGLLLHDKQEELHVFVFRRVDWGMGWVVEQNYMLRHMFCHLASSLVWQ